MPWTIAARVVSVALIPEIIAIYYSSKGYIKTHYLHFLFMTLTWFFMALGNLLIAVAYITMDFLIYKIGVVITAPLAFSIARLVDSIAYNHIDSRKIFIITAASTSLLIFSIEPNSVRINTTGLGEITPALQGGFMVSGSLVFLISGTFWLYYMVLLYRNVPPLLKKVARINLIGAILEGPGSIIAFASGFVWYVPGTDYLLIGLGALLCAYAFQKEPKLGYVLPFRVNLLMVIHKDTSIPLYTKFWENKKKTDDLLFSAALSGISSILKESLYQWKVQSINFDQGILMIHPVKECPVFFVLVSTKSNKILRYSLDRFAQNFVETYRPILRKNDLHMNIAVFKDTEKLVLKHFAYVIDYD